MFKISGSALMVIVLLLAAHVNAAGVKTSYKEYSVFTYENDDILCEPYQVKKDDWLYKIFRQKGEISEDDFPRFLTIFKKINPSINNIDAIAPGINILIPLRKIDKQEYDQKKPGIVQVPVVEFSSVQETFDLDPFIRKQTIQTGDTVSTLLSKKFLIQGGSISREAQKAFSYLNPGIKNIDLIFQGTQVVIPDPSILSQPWFESFLKHGTGSQTPLNSAPGKKASDSQLPVISPQQMIQLKKYAALIQGTLINQGQMVFPGKTAQQDLVIDLIQTPLIESKNGKKTLIIPSDSQGTSLGDDLINNIKAYWKQIKVQEIDKAIAIADKLEQNNNSLADRAIAPLKLIAKLLSITQYPYTPDENIDFSVGSIKMSASFGRITIQDQPDLLINEGIVYGLALEAIEKKGYSILTISPGLTMSELMLTLFTRLGYSTWKNPSFTTGRVEIIKGIYVAKDKEKLFFTRQKPTSTAISFLETENIQFLILNQ